MKTSKPSASCTSGYQKNTNVLIKRAVKDTIWLQSSSGETSQPLKPRIFSQLFGTTAVYFTEIKPHQANQIIILKPSSCNSLTITDIISRCTADKKKRDTFHYGIIMTNQRMAPEQYSCAMLFGHLSNHVMDLFHCPVMWTSVLWGSWTLPSSTNAKLPNRSTWFPWRLPAQIQPMWEEVADELEDCPWNQHLFITHLSLLLIFPKCILRRGWCGPKTSAGKSQRFTWLLGSEMVGKKRKQSHPVFHKSLISSALWAKADKSLQGSPLAKSLFAAPVCTYQKLHEQHSQYFLPWLPHSAYARHLFGVVVPRMKIHQE